jgi:3-hydroxyisobutyrate dehydrogenase-like beta-hydroxyacid dehydrogenase
MRIGFAGLGRMGREMARNLSAAGHEVMLWNRSADKARSLAGEIGAAVAGRSARAVRAAGRVITMLADDAASETVHFGDEGLFAGEAARHFVEMGTMSPDHIAALVARPGRRHGHRRARVRCDAGGPRGAIADHGGL